MCDTLDVAPISYKIMEMVSTSQVFPTLSTPDGHQNDVAVFAHLDRECGNFYTRGYVRLLG